jgi:hypothetical protein
MLPPAINLFFTTTLPLMPPREGEGDQNNRQFRFLPEKALSGNFAYKRGLIPDAVKGYARLSQRLM